MVTTNTKVNKSKTEEKTTALAIAMPITINVGETYRFLADNYITKAKIEKIYQDTTDGESMVIVTIKRKIKGPFFHKTETNSMSVSQFKLRMIGGGVTELEI